MVSARSVIAPGFLRGSAEMFATGVGRGPGDRCLDLTDLGQVRDRLVSAGAPTETTPCLIQLRTRVARGGHVYQVSGILDEMLLLVGADSTRNRARQLATAATSSMPAETARVAVQHLVGRRVTAGEPDSVLWDRYVLADSLWRNGDVDAALAVVRATAWSTGRIGNARILAFWIAIALESHDHSAVVEVDRYRSQLASIDGGALGEAVDMFLAAACHVVKAEFEAAEQLLSAARSRCGARIQGTSAAVYDHITSVWRVVVRAMRLGRQTDGATGPVQRPACLSRRLRQFVRHAVNGRDDGTHPVAVMALISELTDDSSSDGGFARIRDASAVCELARCRWGWSYESTVRRMERDAPEFFRGLLAAVISARCLALDHGDLAVGVASALDLAASLWQDLRAHRVAMRTRVAEGTAGTLSLHAGWGGRRIARTAYRVFGLDGSEFRAVLAVAQAVRGQSVIRSGGVVGNSESRRATNYLVVDTLRSGGRDDVVLRRSSAGKEELSGRRSLGGRSGCAIEAVSGERRRQQRLADDPCPAEFIGSSRDARRVRNSIDRAALARFQS